MTADYRMVLRVFVCVAFIFSLYGGMALITAALFTKGFVLLGAVSGLVLSAMTAVALGLFGLAWSMTAIEPRDEVAEQLVQPG